MFGRRFGKNEVATAEVVDYAIAPENYDYGADENPVIWWVGNTYTQTKKYGFQKVENKLPKPLIKGEPKRSAPFEIELQNGSVIEFYSYDRPASLQGAGVDFMVIDEAAYMEKSIWDNDLRPMLLDNGGGSLLISKPIGENWFYEFYCRGASNDQMYAQPDKQQDGWYGVHGTSYDNPWLDRDEIDHLESVTPEAVFRQEYMADPRSSGTLLTTDMLELVPAETLEGKKWEWHVAVDLGVEMNKSKARENDTDYWSCSIVAEHPTMPHAYLAEVNRTRGQTPAQAASWVRQCIAGYPTNRVRYESVQAQSWFEEDLKQAGLDPIPVTPQGAKEDRIVMLSVPFSNGNVKLIDWSDVPGKDMDWQPFKSEWASFPDGDHDDQLDSTAMALDTVNFQGELPALSGDMYGDRGGLSE